MKTLKKALNVRLQNEKDDQCLFEEKYLETAIETSISALCQFGILQVEDAASNKDNCLCKFQDIIVQGAVLQLLGGQMLLEKGREFKIKDNGISFEPPDVSRLIYDQWTFEYTMYMEKLKLLHNYYCLSCNWVGGSKEFEFAPIKFDFGHPTTVPGEPCRY